MGKGEIPIDPLTFKTLCSSAHPETKETIEKVPKPYKSNSHPCWYLLFWIMHGRMATFDIFYSTQTKDVFSIIWSCLKKWETSWFGSQEIQ